MTLQKKLEELHKLKAQIATLVAEHEVTVDFIDYYTDDKVALKVEEAMSKLHKEHYYFN